MNHDDLARWLPERIARAKTNFRDVSRAAGLGDGAVRDIIGGKSRKPRYDTLLAIAKVLACRVEDLYQDPLPKPEAADEQFPPHDGPIDIAPGSHVEIAGRLPSLIRDLPVLGQAKAGYTGIFIGNGEPMMLTDRPPNLVGVRNAFAVYVRGESMEPRYFDGELVMINPMKPVRRGNFVLIELMNREAFIKRFVKRSDDFVTVEQYNPVSTIDYPAATVRHVYRVVGVSDDA